MVALLARSLNAVGRVGAVLGLRPRLDPEGLLDAARDIAKTGHDFERDDFREPLEVLCRSLDQEADLTFLGRFLARTDLSHRLRNRLLAEQVEREHPDLRDQPVPAPIFVLGLPRTGTTLLHRMLGVDPGNRMLLAWETFSPAPPPETAGYHSDPRIAEAQRHFDGLYRINPRFLQIHEVGARLPEECINLTANDVVSLWYALAYHTPSYRDWLNALDFVPAYENHRRQLQLLQYRHAGRRWVLKAPHHLHKLEALLQVYPDARFVQTHRDPVAVIPSSASLISTFREPLHRRVDTNYIGAEVLEDLHLWLSTAEEVRRRKPNLPWLDVDYRDLVADPMAIVRTIYAAFDLELTSETEAAMREFLGANRQHKHGVHRYAPEDFGLTAAEIRERFQGDVP